MMAEDCAAAIFRVEPPHYIGTTMSSFISCVLQQVLLGDQIENEMGEACGTHGRDEGCIQNFRARWEDNIRVDCRKIGREGTDWMHLVQDETSGRLL